MTDDRALKPENRTFVPTGRMDARPAVGEKHVLLHPIVARCCQVTLRTGTAVTIYRWTTRNRLIVEWSEGGLHNVKRSELRRSIGLA